MHLRAIRLRLYAFKNSQSAKGARSVFGILNTFLGDFNSYQEYQSTYGSVCTKFMNNTGTSAKISTKVYTRTIYY
jgi:hypothetical protein